MQVTSFGATDVFDRFHGISSLRLCALCMCLTTEANMEPPNDCLPQYLQFECVKLPKSRHLQLNVYLTKDIHRLLLAAREYRLEHLPSTMHGELGLSVLHGLWIMSLMTAHAKIINIMS
ncbi:uncharacterized protein LOC111074622 [Drosophila obscura]|uniref:uncharacterized protein LOC111074622 n=1 Tax=Drosophila obscura TaxID=7282 RepID=UPI000BA05BF9|nr:uncharacterized protein LOC111074622 [Drosophila obscura]